MPDSKDTMESLRRGGEAKDKAVKEAEDILSDISDVETKLQIMMHDVVKFHTTCNGFKTAGTSVSVIGTVALLGNN